MLQQLSVLAARGPGPDTGLEVRPHHAVSPQPSLLTRSLCPPSPAAFSAAPRRSGAEPEGGRWGAAAATALGRTGGPSTASFQLGKRPRNRWCLAALLPRLLQRLGGVGATVPGALLRAMPGAVRGAPGGARRCGGSAGSIRVRSQAELPDMEGCGHRRCGEHTGGSGILAKGASLLPWAVRAERQCYDNIDLILFVGPV